MGALLLILVTLGFTPAEQAALDAAQDRTARLDEGALYPLLRDAVDDPAPPWDAVHKDPSAHRGERFVVQGRFLVDEPMDLARSGPWGDTARRWVVQYGESDDDVAVLVLAVPEGVTPVPPRLRQPVSIPVRFYKLWTVQDTKNQWWDFPVFVGRLPERFSAEAGAAASGGGGFWTSQLLVTVLLLVLAFAALVVLRLVLRPRSADRRPLRRPTYDARPTAADDDVEPGDDEDDDEPLPSDPADALDALSRRQDAATSDDRD